jgi:hypothetical protein
MKPLTIITGATFDYVGRVRVPVNGVVLEDYTGYTLQSIVRDVGRKFEYDMKPLWLIQSTGHARFNIPKETTALMVEGVRYFFDVKLLDSAGNVVVSTKQELVISRGIT